MNAAADHLHAAASHLEGDTAPEARDWAGFFEALANFAKEIMPIILPLFGKTPDAKK